MLKEIADRHQATPRQVALRFLTRRAPLFAIPKASSLQHVEKTPRRARFISARPNSRGSRRLFRSGARPRSLPML